MKRNDTYYQVVTYQVRKNGEPGDEWEYYLGTDLEAAKMAFDGERASKGYKTELRQMWEDFDPDGDSWDYNILEEK